MRVLAISEGDIKSRLRLASHALGMVPGSALPDSLRVEYDAIIEALTKRRPPEEGLSALGWTVGGMRRSTASAIARRIVNLSSQVAVLLELR